jgi:hypothetical protein
MTWRSLSSSPYIAALLGVDPKTVAPALSRFYATDAEVVRRAVHAIHAALAGPCDAAAATAAVVCPLASSTTAAAVERCAMAASTLATGTCGASRVDVHAAERYAACAAASVASLPCSRTCTAALSALPAHCGAIVPRADHGFAPGVEHGAACEAALHAAQAGCDAAGDTAGDGACADLLEAAPPSLLRHVAAENADGHIQYLHFAEQSARGVMPSSMCRHGTVHHVDLRGNNLMGSVPECAWSGGQALGNGNLYLSRNLLSGTIGKLGSGHRNVHVNHNRLTGDLGAALADAHSLRMLQASRNKFTGSLDSLKGKGSVRHVHVEGNRLTDTVDSPVAAVLASLPELQSYEISNNRFASHAAAAAAEAAAAASASLGGIGNADRRVDRVALGAAKVAGLSRSVHVVTHLRVPIAHICPMCGDAGQEANCGAVRHCRKHPDVMAHIPKDLHGSMSALMPKIAPEIVNYADAVDVVETIQCALKHEADRFMVGWCTLNPVLKAPAWLQRLKLKYDTQLIIRCFQSLVVPLLDGARQRCRRDHRRPRGAHRSPGRHLHCAVLHAGRELPRGGRRRHARPPLAAPRRRRRRRVPGPRALRPRQRQRRPLPRARGSAPRRGGAHGMSARPPRLALPVRLPHALATLRPPRAPGVG